MLEAFVFSEGWGGSPCSRLALPGDLEDSAVAKVGPSDILGLVLLSLTI